MKKNLVGLAPELLITFLSFFICLCFFPIVTDDYTSFSSSCAAGQFCNYPYCEYYWGYIGVSFIYKFLYAIEPRYDWLSISLIVFEFCALFLILRVIKNVVFQNSPRTFVMRLSQVLFALFFAENIIYLSHTRSSLLFCGSALISLAFCEKVSKRNTFLYTSIFIVGMLIRPESSLGMLLLVSVGYLIYRFDIIHVVKRFFLPAIATVIMLFAYFIDWSNTDLFIKKIEPDVEYRLMENRFIPISGMRTALDSIKYEAAAEGLCFDTRILTPEYFRSILLPGTDWSFNHARLRFFHIFSLYIYYLFIQDNLK